MQLTTQLFVLFTLIVPFGTAFATSLEESQDQLNALNGEWIYFEDRTEGRPLEQQGPPMSAKFSLRADGDSVLLIQEHGSGHRDVRVHLDGKVTKVDGAQTGTYAQYRGSWKGNTFTYETEFVRESGKPPTGLIRKEMTATSDGLQVRVTLAAYPDYEAIAIYRHAADIPLPTPAKAAIDDIDWLSGAWVGSRGTSGTTSIEERWSPPRGGAILAVSRTVSRGKMTAFEYLRIVERNEGLVYIAQPRGIAPTEFVLTELTESRAVFENPRHDYPKRIVYDQSSEGVLDVSIGFTKGGSPRRFEFKREGAKK